MVLFIDIFSINRSRGYENCCLGYYCNRALLDWRLPPQRGKWTLLSVIEVLFLVLFCYHFSIIMVLFWLYCCSFTISSILFMFYILFISRILHSDSDFHHWLLFIVTLLCVIFIWNIWNSYLVVCSFHLLSKDSP